MVAWAPAISAVGSLLGGLGGIFGRKKKQPSPRDNMMSQAAGARDAAAKYGFNPLTMLQYGQPAGTGIADAGPPLASIAMLTDGLSGLADEFSGDADHRRAQERLDYDIAKLKYDQLRTGIVAAGPSGTGVYTSRPNAADNIGGSLSPLGRSNGTRGQTVSQSAPAPFTAANPIAPGRKKDVAELTNSPGVFEMENTMTGGGSITIPGEGEPWGIDELATAVVVGLPQVAWNKIKGRYLSGDYWKDRPGIIPESLKNDDREWPEPGWMEKELGKGHWQ